jgi:hypothetical protein
MDLKKPRVPAAGPDRRSPTTMVVDVIGGRTDSHVHIEVAEPHRPEVARQPRRASDRFDLNQNTDKIEGYRRWQR